MTRAKFTCNSKTETIGWGKVETVYKPIPMYSYQFGVVTGGCPENDKFFASTPAGNISLSCVTDKLFEIGKDYYVDFSPAD